MSIKFIVVYTIVLLLCLMPYRVDPAIFENLFKVEYPVCIMSTPKYMYILLEPGGVIYRYEKTKHEKDYED